MERIYLNDKNIKGMELVDFFEVNAKGQHACDLCGTGLKNIYKISNGKKYAYVGSECVKTIAEKQNVNTLKGINKIPKNKRASVKRDKKDTNQEWKEFIENLTY